MHKSISFICMKIIWRHFRGDKRLFGNTSGDGISHAFGDIQGETDYFGDIIRETEDY